MSIKSERGTKRTCQSASCGSRFYDLNRDPIVCPICGTVYEMMTSAAVGALLAGLASGFVMAAMAAVAGGGNPGPAVTMAGCCALGMVVALVAARRTTVRRRRALAASRRPTAPRPATAHVSPRLRDRRGA